MLGFVFPDVVVAETLAECDKDLIFDATNRILEAFDVVLEVLQDLGLLLKLGFRFIQLAFLVRMLLLLAFEVPI